MKCPLLLVTMPQAMDSEREDYGDCLKSKCAWWDEGQKLDGEHGQCCIKNLTKLKYLAG